MYGNPLSPAGLFRVVWIELLVHVKNKFFLKIYLDSLKGEAYKPAFHLSGVAFYFVFWKDSS